MTNVSRADLMNGMYRVESDNSVDADEPIMKHMTEGGVTILKQIERKRRVSLFHWIAVISGYSLRWNRGFRSGDLYAPPILVQFNSVP